MLLFQIKPELVISCAIVLNFLNSSTATSPVPNPSISNSVASYICKQQIEFQESGQIQTPLTSRLENDASTCGWYRWSKCENPPPESCPFFVWESCEENHAQNVRKKGRGIAAKAEKQGDYEAIVKGVKIVALGDGSQVGVLTVYGDNAFPILAGKNDDKTYLPVAAASIFGKGRIIGFAHTNFFAYESPKKSDINQLILNSIKWGAQAVEKPKVAAIAIEEATVGFLNKNNMDAKLLDVSQIGKLDDLKGYNVVMAKMQDVPSAVAAIMKDFVKNGGGVVMSATAWALKYELDAPFSTQAPLNMVSAESGFVWRDDYAGVGFTSGNSSFLVSNEFVQFAHFNGNTWKEIEIFLKTGEISDTLSSKYEQVAAVLSGAILSLPASKGAFSGNKYELLKKFATELPKQPVPQEKEPVKDGTEKLKLKMFWYLHLFLNPQDVSAHPASKFFPGEVKMKSQRDIAAKQVNINFKKYSGTPNASKKFMPSFENHCDGSPVHFAGLAHENRNFGKPKNQNVVKGEEQVQLNVTHVLWFSTGLYAPPGQVIEISATAAQNLSTCSVLIGCHTDDIAELEEWWRAPVVVKFQQFEKNKVVSASPYGGIIYFIVPETEVGKLREVNLTIKGAVKHTHKVLDGDYFKFTQNYSNVPWVELETDNVVLTFPFSNLPSDKDVEFLLSFWNQVLDAIADFAQIPRKRPRQERLVVDIQIGYGDLHAGYPVMGPLPEVANFNDVKNMFQGDNLWSWFHELGHNHQADSWTFPATVETTNNIFVCYLFETLVRKPFNETREQLFDETRNKTSTKYFANGTFGDWQKDAWLSLLTYMELRELYGWSAYKLVFRTYQDLPKIGEKEPTNDQEKIDLFYRVFSKVVNQNLKAFFKKWKWPLSE